MSNAVAQSLEEKHEQMLYPTVRVRAENVGGSGTVVYSKKDKAGRFRTYVMTNHHVVEGLIKVQKRWDSFLKTDRKMETTKTATVEYFKYNNWSHSIGSFGVEADIVAYDKNQDWALLESRDQENKAGYVAKLYPREKIDNIHVLDEVFAVGASMGHAPITTFGTISFMDDEIENYTFWMSTAQTIFGHSGGAVFRWSKPRKQFEFIGIPSRITVANLGFSTDAITHMGYLIPIDRIYNLLEDHMFRFIYSDKHTIKSEEKAREKKREAAEKLRFISSEEEETVDAPSEYASQGFHP